MQCFILKQIDSFNSCNNIWLYSSLVYTVLYVFQLDHVLFSEWVLYNTDPTHTPFHHRHRHQDDHKCEKLETPKPRMAATQELVQRIVGQYKGFMWDCIVFKVLYIDHQLYCAVFDGVHTRLVHQRAVQTHS